ncbi:uncharacterized protein LOC132038087 [Lycium ferocissimum]|uniref:uncharacterized protein LOC132038087 n=1 Tax=Lycium ferocissimum TaxID=112874 RepID=UPI0028169B4A|nr:uncharacterized protein LOC132038087 [Lycium ferocissimum]
MDDDVTHRIGRMDEMEATSGVLCDKNVPPILKEKFSKAVVRQAILYGTECLRIKKARIEMKVGPGMRMLRWMCGHTMRDRIRNEVIRDKVGVAPVMDKMREGKLRWFGHARRRCADAPVRKCERMAVVGLKRGRGRPKKAWGEVIWQDMVLLQLIEDMTGDRRGGGRVSG